MKILYIELENFIGIQAAMKAERVYFDFGKIDKPIIQIYGPNHCGKTVLIHLLNPFANINFTGDERNDLSLIIPGKIGKKKIGYSANGSIYNITHTYNPTKTSHTISSSIEKDGVELNPSGGVNVFNSIIQRELGINKYIFQFIINGTQLTNMSSMSDTQRKNAMYKSQGIDIYTAIHKMATDDYRYTNKLITALNNSREFLLSNYGTHENMIARRDMKRTQFESLSISAEKTKTRLDSLSGQITALRKQNIAEELITISNQMKTYDSVCVQLGEISSSLGDNLVNEQISLNEEINQIKIDRLTFIKDRDSLYSKRDDIQHTMAMNRKSISDYEDMCRMRDNLSEQIKAMPIYDSTSTSPAYLSNMLNLANVVNSTSKEIIICLNDTLLNLLCDMLEKGIDVNGFLIKEGASLQESESEKAAVHRLHNILTSVAGDIDNCDKNQCLYKRSYDMMQKFFSSYQTSQASSFTAYDMEQLEISYKNIQSIRRVITVNIAEECKYLFTMKEIAHNLRGREYGIDTSIIEELIERATSEETRLRLIAQLSEINMRIESMSGLLFKNGESNEKEMIDTLNKQIDEYTIKITECDNMLASINQKTEENKRKRILFSSIRDINIGDLKVRFSKLSKLNQELRAYEEEYNMLQSEYASIESDLRLVSTDLKNIEDIYNQYANIITEIDKYAGEDKQFKIISEATSSTKGKPVISTREKVYNALTLQNRLLDVMYDGEMEMLTPTIDENEFSLPFRSGTNRVADIRYGSQSESALLGLTFNLALMSTLTNYDVVLLDESDAFLDATMADSFVLMINEIMNVLQIEQLFIISHNIAPDHYLHCVHTFHLLEELKK